VDEWPSYGLALDLLADTHIWVGPINGQWDEYEGQESIIVPYIWPDLSILHKLLSNEAQRVDVTGSSRQLLADNVVILAPNGPDEGLIEAIDHIIGPFGA
jgi:hypothetical protein